MSKIVILDSIRSMQNVGAIFRNSDGAGFDKVILTGYTPYPPRNDISKTALGAEDFIDWEYYENINDVINKLKKQGYKIYSLEIDKRSIDYKEFIKHTNNIDEKIVLILGNEVSGISKKLLDLSDKIIKISMNGKKESLNVSVAAGIVMYALSN